MVAKTGLEAVASTLKNCLNCGLCTGNGPVLPFKDEEITVEVPTPRCPILAYFKFIAYSPRGLSTLASSVFYQNFPVTDDLAKIAYSCTTCKLCDELCAFVYLPMFRGLREEIVNRGVGPLAPSKQVDENIRKTDNFFGKDPQKRTAWADGLSLPKTGNLLYFVGCHTSYNHPKVARATVSILREAGCDVAYLGDKEACCGNHFIWDGEIRMAKAWGTKAVNAIKASGAKEVVFSCPEGYRAFKLDYPEMLGKLPFKVVHTSELFSRLINEGKIKFKKKVNMKLTYHDPCRLGRHLGIYDEPRNVLNQIEGIKLVEMRTNKRWASCCGAGGTVTLKAFPDFAEWVAVRRLEEAKEVSNALVTACPICETLFKDTAEKRNIDIAIYNLSTLVAQAMDIKV